MAITIDELQIEIQAKGAESANGINDLTTSLAALKKMVNKTLTNKLGELSSALDKIKAPITVNMNVKGMEQLKGAVKSATSNVPAGAITPTVDGTAVSGELDKISGSAAQAAGELEQLVSPASKAKSELDGAGKTAGGTAADMDRLRAAAAKLGYTLEDVSGINELKKSLNGTGYALRKVGDDAKHGASGLSKFVSSLKRILMYRVVRFILSNIARAAKEGIQNLVQYSKAIGGIDASKANATMSQFASIGMQVKNTLGSALMPVLKAIMPVIQTLANWFIIAANAVNQLLAAISGASTWSKATAGAVDYADGLGKAAGSAKKLANATLGIDELNIISPDAGGGGGAGGMDFGKMFEEVKISEKLQEILQAIRGFFVDIWERIKDSGAVERLTTAWDKFKESLNELWNSPGMQSLIGWLKEVIPLVITLAGITIINTLADLTTILTDVVNLINAIINGDIAGVVNEVKNLLVDILALPFGSIADIIDTLFGTDIRGWLDDLVATIKKFDLAAWFVRAWEDIKSAWQDASKWFDTNVIQPIGGFFSNLWSTISGFFVGVWNDITGFFTGFWNGLVQAATSVWEVVRIPIALILTLFDWVWQGIKSIYEAVANWFQTNVITPVSTAFNTLVTNIKTFFQNTWTSIKNIWSVVYNWFDTNVVQPVYSIFSKVTTNIKTFFETAWTGIKSIWTSVSSWFTTNVITPVRTAFNTVTTAIGGFFTILWTGIKDTFNGVANWFKTNVTDPIGNFFKGAINIVIDALNALIRGLNKIRVTVPDWVADLLGMSKGSTLGFNIATIPTLAEGGFVDSGQLFMARENGLTEMVGAIGNKAAVANNDQIVDGIRDGVYEAVVAAMSQSDNNNGGGFDVKVYLDGKQITATVEKYQRERGRLILSGGVA
jgi:phage-related protein